MEAIELNSRINYAAFFLTLSCNLRCPYCINLHERQNRGDQARRGSLSAAEWIEAANRLVLSEDLPLTLQGGEPTLHPGFFEIVREVNPQIRMDLLTNMMFDVDAFIREVPLWRFSRPAAYAPIRVSYHPGQNRIEDLLERTERMTAAGFRVGLYGILVPDGPQRQHVLDVQKRCLDRGVDFRTKEFLGEWNGRMYGTFKYAGSVCSDGLRNCECRTSELIVDPSGDVYRCHADLYRGRNSIAHVLDAEFDGSTLDQWRECLHFGQCNPCDVKVTTNRFQRSGHTSVEIRQCRPCSVGATNG